MTDPIDEYCVQNMAKFDGKYAWGNVGKEGLKLPVSVCWYCLYSRCARCDV
jgi:hypothetical protein